MPPFEPFRALRYNPERVSIQDVVAPPYDVIDAEELARLEARSPYNVVHVDLAHGDAADDDPGGEADVYQVARRRLDDWLAAGVLAIDDGPGFYVYRMGWRDGAGRPRQTSGVLGLVALDPDETGSILPHERTMAKPLDDRLRLLRACRANVSPIWGLSLASGLSGLCQVAGPPLARCTDDDGVHHRLWRLTSPATLATISAVVGSAPLVIADGHHRYQTALAYQAEQREATGGQPGPWDLVMTYVVELADEELGLRPIHRLLTDLPHDLSLPDALAGAFDLEPAGPPSAAVTERLLTADAMGLVLPGHAFSLRPRPDGDPTRLADTERLEAALADLPRPPTVAFHHDAAAVLAMVDKGDAQAGILLRPVTVAQIALAAREGRRLPEKTSFFHPKPRTGMVLRRLDS